MRYFLALLAGFLIAGAAYAGLFFLSLKRPGADSALVAQVEFKQALAAAITEPKIVFTSGSNGLYGINALDIERATGRPCVNMATRVQIALDYHFHKLKQVVRAGDVVILALEYEYYFRNSGVIDAFSTYVLEGDPDYLRTRPLAEQASWMASASFFGIGRRLLHSPAGARAIREDSARLMRDQLDARGDLTGHTKASQTPADLAEVEAARPKLVAFKWRRMSQPEFWADITAFSQWCRDHGVTLLATFPSTIYFPEYESDAARRCVKNVLAAYARAGVRTLGTPYDFMMPPGAFFNSGYHLHEAASHERTARLINVLRPALDSATPPPARRP